MAKIWLGALLVFKSCWNASTRVPEHLAQEETSPICTEANYTKEVLGSVRNQWIHYACASYLTIQNRFSNKKTLNISVSTVLFHHYSKQPIFYCMVTPLLGYHMGKSPLLVGIYYYLGWAKDYLEYADSQF